MIRWLCTFSLGMVVVLASAVGALVYFGHPGWASTLTLPLGWALARWGIRVAAFIHPVWFNPMWLQRQGWSLR